MALGSGSGKTLTGASGTKQRKRRRNAMPFKLTPEAQERANQYLDLVEKRKAEFANLTDENLAATTEFYMRNAKPQEFAPGEPVYDATLWHIILPELLRRIRNGAA
jgi:hypothetical protein